MRDRIVWGARLLGIALLAGTSGAHAQEVPKQDGARIEEYMAACVKYRHFSGAVLVARDGKVLLSKGYGLANRENDVPCTPQTKFRIGSVSKPFTAMAVMILQERGKLDVRDKVKKHLPDSPAAWDEITVHHLLTHSSGIPNITEVKARYMHLVAKSITPEELVASFRDMPLLFQPGEKGQYSNSNYILLGMIIEKVSGQHYDRFLDENIFRPLDMKDTGFDRARPILKHRAAGYLTWGFQVVNAAPIDMSVPFAAGGLYSTTEDLYRWDQALSTTSVMSAKTLEQIFTPDKAPNAHPGVSAFGYAWAIAKVFNQRRTLVTHQGGINGFTAVMNRYPKERVSVIVLSNCEWTPIDAIGADLGAIVLGEKYKVPAATQTVTVDAGKLDSYTGSYEVDGKIFDLLVPSHFLDWPVGKASPKLIVTISREGKQLLAQIDGQPPVELLAESETRFFCRDAEQRVTFVRDQEGRVTHLRLGWNGDAFKAVKLNKAPREDEPQTRKPPFGVQIGPVTREVGERQNRVGSPEESFRLSLVPCGPSTTRSSWRRCAAGEASCYNPQWSPADCVVAFLSARSGKTNVWLVRSAGGEARRLTDVATGVASFR